MISWLIDNGKDQEGLEVLADLHGGDLNNSVAQAEFKEIRGKVISEVLSVSSLSLDSLIHGFLSVKMERVDHTRRCGPNIANVFC